MNLNQQEQASADDVQIILELARRLAPLRLSPYAQVVLVRETAKVEVEVKQASKCPNETELATKRGSGGWKLKVSALARWAVPRTCALLAVKSGVTVLPRAPLAHRPVDEPKRVVSTESQVFQIQFVCTTPDRGTPTLKETLIEAADVSAAIVAAAKSSWPPQTIALRILNREGCEVFARGSRQWQKGRGCLADAGKSYSDAVIRLAKEAAKG
jgi:hypothetical protein